MPNSDEKLKQLDEYVRDATNGQYGFHDQVAFNGIYGITLLDENFEQICDFINAKTDGLLDIPSLKTMRSELSELLYEGENFTFLNNEKGYAYGFTLKTLSLSIYINVSCLIYQSSMLFAFVVSMTFMPNSQVDESFLDVVVDPQDSVKKHIELAHPLLYENLYKHIWTSKANKEVDQEYLYRLEKMKSMTLSTRKRRESSTQTPQTTQTHCR